MATPTSRMFRFLWTQEDLLVAVFDGFVRQVQRGASRQSADDWLKALAEELILPDFEIEGVEWSTITEFLCDCFYALRARQPPPELHPETLWEHGYAGEGKVVLHPQRERAILETVPVSLLPLEQHLLTLGGHRVVYIGEPHLFELISRGQAFEGRARLVSGQPCECHRNSADLWLAYREKLGIVTGYALSRDGVWRQHTWLLRRYPTAHQRRLIETTERRERYFGFVLDESEADTFSQLNGSGAGEPLNTSLDL